MDSERKLPWRAKLTIVATSWPSLLVVMGVLIVVGAFVSLVLEAILAALYVGFMIGSIGGLSLGLHKYREIADETLGQHWFEDACRGKRERDAASQAPWN